MALERRWYTAGTNQALWHPPDAGFGTYRLVEWEKLPPVDRTRHDGSFDWLAEQPETYGMGFGHDEEDPPEEETIAELLDTVVASAKEAGLEVPKAFLALMADGERTYRRIPTCTACYFDLGDRVTEIPGEPGRMLRFMNDQQCCFVWGLHLLPGGAHQVVVATPSFRDEADGPYLEGAADFTDHAICASDIEEFIHRFWLENTLWFQRANPDQWTQEMSAYAAHAVASR